MVPDDPPLQFALNVDVPAAWAEAKIDSPR